ncbi:Ras guanine nucleotide exchange factor [Pelomyxa schiedti]|nr:Ras guanine nucleotide exchange factor [Pelomyxa schiedti]
MLNQPPPSPRLRKSSSLRESETYEALATTQQQQVPSPTPSPTPSPAPSPTIGPQSPHTTTSSSDHTSHSHTSHTTRGRERGHRSSASMSSAYASPSSTCTSASASASTSTSTPASTSTTASTSTSTSSSISPSSSPRSPRRSPETGTEHGALSSPKVALLLPPLTSLPLGSLGDQVEAPVIQQESPRHSHHHHQNWDRRESDPGQQSVKLGDHSRKLSYDSDHLRHNSHSHSHRDTPGTSTTSSDDSTINSTPGRRGDHRHRRSVLIDRVTAIGDIRSFSTDPLQTPGQMIKLPLDLRSSTPLLLTPCSPRSEHGLTRSPSGLSISTQPVTEGGPSVAIILCESIFVNFPVRAVHFQSGTYDVSVTAESPSPEPTTITTPPQPTWIPFPTEFLSTPKVCAWSFGSPEAPALSTVTSSKISSTRCGFNVSLEGRHIVRWISYTTPATHASLKDAIRLCLAHPRDNVSPGLLEKLEECTKTVGINGPAVDGQTLLHAAAYAGNLELIKWLLKRDADVESKDEMGWTPIMCAINQGFFSIAQFLISKGATISVITCRKQTPLHLLAKSYKQDDELAYKLLRTILASHCPVNARTDTGDTALMFACCVSSIQMEFITTLLESRADPNISNNKGETPLSKAAETKNPELIEALSIYNTFAPASQPQPLMVDISRLVPELPPGPQPPLPLEVLRLLFEAMPSQTSLFQSGRFKVQQRRMVIDFSAPFSHPPTVLVWSFVGSRSQMPVDRITPSQLSFTIILDGLPLASPLNWVAYMPPSTVKPIISKHKRLLGSEDATPDQTNEPNKPPVGPPILELLHPSGKAPLSGQVIPAIDNAEYLAPVTVEHATEEMYTPLDVYAKFQEYFQLFEEPDSEENIRWMRIPIETAANLAPGSREYMIRGGTVFKLVQYLTHQEESDMDFVHSFLISHSAYVDDIKLFDMLVARFFMRRPVTFDSDEFTSKIRNIVRLRVVNIIRTWATLYFDDFQDPVHLQKLTTTLEIFSKYCKAATVVLSLILRKANTVAIPTTTPPSIVLKADVTSVLDVHPEELARQITLLEWNVWRKIRPREFVRNAWTKPLLKEKLAANITEMIVESNKRTMWCISEVVRFKSEKERALAIHRLILTADACFRIRNFNGLMEIISSLQNSAVHRLKHSWSYLPPTTWDLYDKYCAFLDAKGNFQQYRDALKVSVTPCIPYLGMILTDLTFANDGNPDLITGTQLVNFAKYRHTSGIVKALQLWQVTGFSFDRVEKIQHYLNGSKVLTADESFDMSLSLEPPNKSGTPAKINTSAVEKASRDIFGKDNTLLLKAQKMAAKGKD